MNKLAIVGSHPETRDAAPFDDPDYDIWVFNESAMSTKEFYKEFARQWCKRWDAVIQIHKPDVYRSETNWVNDRHWEWLQRDHGERAIWMQTFDEDVQNSKRYPLDEIVDTVPGGFRKWFRSTPAYAIALALYLGYKDIGCFGFDMGSNTEYGYQLMNFAYWIGVCDGMGINLYHLSNDKYFTGTLYGYEGELQLPQSYFEERRDKMSKGFYKANKESNKLRDRMTEAITECKFDKIPPLANEWRNVVIQAGALSAAEQEAKNYIEREDSISRQEFERRAATAQMQQHEQNAKMYAIAGKVELMFEAWRQTGEIAPRQRMQDYMNASMQLAYNSGAQLGAYKENMQYCGDFDERLQAAGGPRTLAAVRGGHNGDKA